MKDGAARGEEKVLPGETGRTVREGDVAPDFTLRDQTEKPVRLYEELERGPVVLYFYPRDFTPTCTREGCAFRDAHEDFVAKGATVLGISDDSPESHRKFAERHEFPFQLLYDEGGHVRRRYGVPKALGFIEGRVTYVVGQDRVVHSIIESQFRAHLHVERSLEALTLLAFASRAG